MLKPCSGGIAGNDNLPRGRSLIARIAPFAWITLSSLPHRQPELLSAFVSQSLTLTLPDGSTRNVAAGTLPLEVVRSIGERLARDAIAVEINGDVQDLMTPLRASGPFRVLTAN